MSRRITAVVFDVGETLVDEAATHGRWEAEGIAGGAPFEDRDLHPDALPCFAALRGAGHLLGAAGNMRAMHEDFLRAHVDFVGSSERWDVWKPAAGFFERIRDLAGVPSDEIAYVGDRVDNDVLPSLAAGMVAVHIRRGAHAHVPPPAGVASILSLAELPEALARA
ncbi:MAG TPA: HAD family hydrolase [Gaiellaceae bacterium]|nr:HAD family hydrolase [Gaiellaceae bacterium]